MRSSIIIKIFVSFLLVSLLPIGALIAFNDWANRRIVYNMKIEEVEKQARKLSKSIDRELSFKKEIVSVLVMMCEAGELWKLIEDEKDYLGKGSLCILTDGYGIRIAHATDRSLIFKSWV